MPKAKSDLFQTPIGFLSFPNLAKPRAAEAGAKEKYSTAIVFHEDTDISEVKAIALGVLAEAFYGGDEKKAKKAVQTGAVKWPFRRDLESKGYEERAGEGGTFLNARSSAERRPGVVFPYKDPDTGKPASVPLEQVATVAYPGANARLLLQAYSYDHPQGGKGVSLGLAGVQVTGGGERLDGRVAAEDAFEVDDEATPEDFDNLPGAVDAEGEEEEETKPDTEEEDSDEGVEDPLDDL